MATYFIEMGEISGEYTGATEAEALDAFASDAGYSSWDDACSQGLASNEATTVLEIDIDALCNAAPALVAQDSYGSGVALMGGVSFSSYQELAQAFGRNVWEFRAA